jgi:hypothetical protein
MQSVHDQNGCWAVECKTKERMNDWNQWRPRFVFILSVGRQRYRLALIVFQIERCRIVCRIHDAVRLGCQIDIDRSLMSCALLVRWIKYYKHIRQQAGTIYSLRTQLDVDLTENETHDVQLQATLQHRENTITPSASADL